MFVPVIVFLTKKNDPSFGLGKNSKVMPQLSCYLSFLLGKGGKSLYLKPYFKKNFKNTQVRLLTDPLQRTSLDLWCISDTPQNCPTLQNFMYMSCISKTACFLANYAPHSLWAGRKMELYGSKQISFFLNGVNNLG